MKVTLGPFARSGIEAHLGADVEAVVHTAIVHYTHGLQSGRAPIGLPPFCRDQGASRDADIAFDLAVDRDSRRLLEREAARQGTTVNRLASHSVLTYLAELDLIETVPLQAGTDPV